MAVRKKAVRKKATATKPTRKRATRKKVTRKKTPQEKGRAKQGTRERRKPENETKYRMFLSAYRKISNMTQACNIAGITKGAVQDRMQREPEFKAKVLKAKGVIVKRLVDGQIHAATHPDAHGRIDSKAGQFMLTNIDPEAYKHRRDDTIFDGNAYESGIAEARKTLTDEEKKELQEMGRRRILQRGTAT